MREIENDMDIIKQILLFLQDKFIENPVGYISKQEILDTLSISKGELLQHSFYLDEKNYIKVIRALGDRFRSAKITGVGLALIYEAGWGSFLDNGLWFKILSILKNYDPYSITRIEMLEQELPEVPNSEMQANLTFLIEHGLVNEPVKAASRIRFLQITARGIDQLDQPLLGITRNISLLEDKFEQEFSDDVLLSWIKSQRLGVEDFDLEFKVSLPGETEKIAKVLVGFANGRSGVMCVGINDDGEIVGIENPDRVRNRIVNIAHSSLMRPELDVKFRTIQTDNKLILLVLVPLTKQIASYNKKTYVRRGGDTHEIGPEEIIQLAKAKERSEERSDTGFLFLRSLLAFKEKSESE